MAHAINAPSTLRGKGHNSTVAGDLEWPTKTPQRDRKSKKCKQEKKTQLHSLFVLLLLKTNYNERCISFLPLLFFEKKNMISVIAVVKPNMLK